MHILVITSTYPTPTRPRQGAFNHVMVQGLRSNHRVAVIAPIPWPQMRWRDAFRVGIFQTPVVHSIEADTQHPIYYYSPLVLRRYYHKFYWRSICNSLSKLPADFQPDVVVGYWLHPDGSAAVQAARHFGVPAVVMSGGTDLRILTRGLKRREAITRVMNDADRVVVVSRELGRQAECFGIPDHKIDVVYRGVNHACFSPGDRLTARQACGLVTDGLACEKIVLVWAGRLEAVKNPKMLLHAAVRWKRHWGSRFSLLIVGDGRLRSSMQRLCRQLELDDNVRFEGNLRQTDLANCYRAANVTILTSHSEGAPNVLLESIACGVPFVATDVGGVREIATAGLDRLVDDYDTEGLASATIELVEAGRMSTGGGLDLGMTEPQRKFVPTDRAGMSQALETVLQRAIQDASTMRNAQSQLRRRAS